MESKIKCVNLSMKQKETHRCRELRCVCQRGQGGEGKIDWEFGTSRCKLIYMKN